MKDLGEATHIPGIKILCDCKKRILGLSQTHYIDTTFIRFNMPDFNKEFLPFKHKISLSKDQCHRTNEKIEGMKEVPNASVVGSLMYVMLCNTPGIYYVIGMVSKF